MTQLVEDMLLLARLDTGRPLERGQVDLSPLIVERVSDAHIAGPEHSGAGPARGARGGRRRQARLHQVLANLLANARTHTPPGTAVTAWCTRRRRRADGRRRRPRHSGGAAAGDLPAVRPRRLFAFAARRQHRPRPGHRRRRGGPTAAPSRCTAPGQHGVHRDAAGNSQGSHRRPRRLAAGEHRASEHPDHPAVLTPSQTPERSSRHARYEELSRLSRVRPRAAAGGDRRAVPVGSDGQRVGERVLLGGRAGRRERAGRRCSSVSDAANAITVDKTPAALWVIGLSARLFGFNSWSMLVPQALRAWRRSGAVRGGPRVVRAGPALLAGAVLALTPVAALMFRFNNPDALLVLLLVAAAYCVAAGVRKGQPMVVDGRRRAGRVRLPGQDAAGVPGGAGIRRGVPGGRTVGLRRRVGTCWPPAAALVSGGW